METKDVFKRAAAVAASGVLVGSLAVVTGGTANAAVTGVAAEPCHVSMHAVAETGKRSFPSVVGWTPPALSRGGYAPTFTSGTPKIASRVNWGADPGGSSIVGYVVLGSSLYRSVDIHTDGEGGGTGEFEHTETKIADGWDKFTMIEESWAGTTPTARNARYGLRNDGVLFRWTNGFKTVASAPGFTGIKAMTLISQTATYDTFLANTKAGVLQTIRIPTTTPLKPVVKTVRGSTWQGFEMMVADRCGTGVLLTAIDKDTKSAYVYKLGHATGTTTPITNLGKLNEPLGDVAYSRYTVDATPPLAGE
ncbi:hypothetical protein ACFTSF_33870 [Kribbella sp. NPDC056951]|uniref:hypothetical protein n=1 Tax=Kribbella sp. NPDC056951 TaxID=3345978 RepID=UPI0036452419